MVHHDEEVVSFSVTVAIVKDAFGLLAVSATSPTLLHVAFETLWNGVMDNKPDVMFVDSHPKGNSGNDNLDLVPHPLCLDV